MNIRIISILVLITLLFCNIARSQSSIVFEIKDGDTKEKLANVSVTIGKTGKGGITDSLGTVKINGIPDGKKVFNFSLVGYTSKTTIQNFPTTDSILYIDLQKAEAENLDEVIVSSSRTESRIENLPTKVEVLGAEEVNEEVGIKPGNIASLLGDVAGIQTQQTSAATGNTEMRVQGLPGKYTQLLKDGMPLFGGYSGSFSILQIPPLDLKQIEIVKGASSTLYGGGAIAGMINLVSKKPVKGVFEKTILLNQSSLKETNANVYLSNRNDKFGYTFFTGVTRQKEVDVNKDGYSDVPYINSFFLHPVLFFYPNAKNSLSLGYNAVFENRKGGDMQVLKEKADNLHQYFDQNKTSRNSIEFNWEDKLNAKDRFTLKSTASWLNRKIETNVFGMKANQLSYFAEASYLKKLERHDIVAGLTLTGEDFTKKKPDSTQLADYTNTTIGAFVQDDWRLNSVLTLETGLRLDHHNTYGDFLLPRLSLLYKINSYFTTRFGGGLGYKIPTVFNSEIDERDYMKIIQSSAIKAERSAGINWDINYHHRVNAWDITVNQMFYFTNIQDPIVIDSANSIISFSNASKPINTRGFETYVQLRHDKLEIYLGYTYTVARKKYDDVQPYLSLSARNKFASVLAYEFSNHFRAGIEAAFTGRQYLDDGRRTPAFPFLASMMRYDISHFSFVLNCENVLDYRQTRKETFVSGPATNPIFNQLWAPIDGRVVNLSMRIRL